MKYSVALLLCAVCIHENSAAFGFGEPWARNSLKARYSPLIYDGFYDLPMSTDSGLINQDAYVKIDSETAQLDVPGDLYCQENDSRFCVIYDTKGTVVGGRTSFLKQDVEGVDGYDYETISAYKKTNVFNQTAYALDVYYRDPATITEEGVEESSEVANGVWAEIDGQIVSLPTTDPKIENYNGFQRQACFPQMGQHYFYGMNKTQTDCTKSVPLFGIYHNGGLVGYGIANYGKPSQVENGRNWYETVPLLGAKLIMPNRPPCLDENITNNGLYSLHVYFVQTPALITCLFQ